MSERALDSDELTRRLLRAWNLFNSREFPWAHEDRLHSTFRRLLDEAAVTVAVGVRVGDHPALLLLAEDEAKTVSIHEKGVETRYLGAMIGGTLTVVEEQIDAARARMILRYRHSRLAGDLVHIAETGTAVADQDLVRAILRRWSTGPAI